LDQRDSTSTFNKAIKGDISYSEWRFEVQCLSIDPDVSPNVLTQAIRRSLRGTARKMLIPLGPRVRTKDILTKLDILFGDISTNEMIMQEFFNSYQKPEETVTTFGCRLESMLQSAIDGGYLQRKAKNELLRHKFWTSLYSDKLKSQTRHKYDTIQDYDVLLRELRKIEKELSINLHGSNVVSSKKVHQQAVVTDSLESLSSLEKKIDRKMENLEKRLNDKMDQKFDLILKKLDSCSLSSQPTVQPACNYRGQPNQFRSRGHYDQQRRGNFNQQQSRGHFGQRGNFRQSYGRGDGSGLNPNA